MNKPKAVEITYVLQAVMAWQVSPVQNSEMVLYCRLIRLKNVVAVRKTRERERVHIMLFSVCRLLHRNKIIERTLLYTRTMWLKYWQNLKVDYWCRVTFSYGWWAGQSQSHAHTNPSAHHIRQRVCEPQKRKLKNGEVPPAALASIEVVAPVT